MCSRTGNDKVCCKTHYESRKERELPSSGIQHRTVWQKFIDTLEGNIASIFRVIS